MNESRAATMMCSAGMEATARHRGASGATGPSRGTAPAHRRGGVQAWISGFQSGEPAAGGRRQGLHSRG